MHTTYHTWLCTGSGDLNSGPSIRRANAFPMEPSPRCYFLLMEYGQEGTWRDLEDSSWINGREPGWRLPAVASQREITVWNELIQLDSEHKDISCPRGSVLFGTLAGTTKVKILPLRSVKGLPRALINPASHSNGSSKSHSPH